MINKIYQGGSVKSKLSWMWFNIQGKLFPHLEENVIEEPWTDENK
jgi:hypothetical protein